MRALPEDIDNHDERATDCETRHTSPREGRVRFAQMSAIGKRHESRAAVRRSAKVVRIRRVLSATETTELQRLFDLIADTVDAGNIILGTGSELEVELERVRELTKRVDAMVSNALSILD
jgi:hypothetical protein